MVWLMSYTTPLVAGIKALTSKEEEVLWAYSLRWHSPLWLAMKDTWEPNLRFEFQLLCPRDPWNKKDSTCVPLVQRQTLPEMPEAVIYGREQATVFPLLTEFVWLSCTGYVWSQVGRRYMGRKCVKTCACPWLDLVGNVWYNGFAFLDTAKCDLSPFSGNSGMN